MGYSLKIEGLTHTVNRERTILRDLTLTVPAGAFVAILGENGAGKTTLLDMIMGFRSPTAGTIHVDGAEPAQDHWEKRTFIAYLSEKMDLPGDWSVADFLGFNRFFYPHYSAETEARLTREFKVKPESRVGNLSAGELRRVQVVAALSATPKLIVADEITAVLDIIGRQKFLRTLHELNQGGATVVLATNILEDLVEQISHVALMSGGALLRCESIAEFLGREKKESFSRLVAERLEAE